MPFALRADEIAQGQNRYTPGQNSYAQGQNPYALGQNYYALGQNSYAQGQNPPYGAPLPFAQQSQTHRPPLPTPVVYDERGWPMDLAPTTGGGTTTGRVHEDVDGMPLR
jgi:hypothetical protein